MHAALILLYRSLAFWTLFRVQFDPVRCVFVSLRNPVKPFLKKIAIHRFVCTLGTSEAEVQSTSGAIYVDGISILALTCHGAIPSRAPLCLLRKVDKGFQDELFVPIVLLFR